MRTGIIILTLFFLTDLTYGQKVKSIIEYHFQVDSLNGKIVKTFEYDPAGSLIIERLSGFKPLGSKYRSTGTWIYAYEDGSIATKTLVDRPDADTILISYKYSGYKIRIKRDELVTLSKIKDGLEYGYGSENGCIDPPEALASYKYG